MSEEGEDRRFVTVDVLAKLFDLSSRRIQQLRQDGVLKTTRTKAGMRYDSVLCVRDYIRHLRDCLEGKERKAASAELEKQRMEADVRYRRAKAEKEEILLALMRGEVHKAEHVRLLFNGMIMESKAAFMAIPGRCAMDCSHASPNEAADIIKGAIYEVMAGMASRSYDPERFAALVREDGDKFSNGDEYDDEES